MVDTLLKRSLLLDFEIQAGGRKSIHRIGALVGGLEGRSFQWPSPSLECTLDQALEELGRLGESADFVLGHNLCAHDLPALKRQAPGHSLLTKPVIDTLILSPLAFPENPYHHLVKDYKLVREALNDPLEDARLAGAAFREQAQSLKRQDSKLLAFFAQCLSRRGRGGMTEALARMAGREPLDEHEAVEFLHGRWAGKVCRTMWEGLVRQELAKAKPSALAFATAWLEVAGGSSVLPPWVRRQHPEAVRILEVLRETPCDHPRCRWCFEFHDPDLLLWRFFGFESFRPEPEAPGGGSLQRAVTAHALAGKSLLAILPTGAGKSVCYQLPALSRFHRRGVLTIVISPLQALMKDQVDHLNAVTGVESATALYGLLTPPERGRALERVRLGDVAILYVAPEQLRNRSFQRAVMQREIAAWVFDEAHCLSKWGHDFRPDYLYVSRFIKHLAERQGVEVPPVICFTATAKRDVRREIVEHFADVLGLELKVFESSVERDELCFQVEAVAEAQKLPRILERLEAWATGTVAGSAVVYFATRRGSVHAAEFLAQQGLPARAFHAGLDAAEKRDVLEAFIAGQSPVVCATSAFGMGIDKDDVRLVIHADIPGSLESYLQEAGRAGRDRRPSECVLLFDPKDVETQFRQVAGSRLEQRDVARVLRALRRARKAVGGTVAITTGELMRDAEVAMSFDDHRWQADTKIKAAVSWLERAGFLERRHNQTRVFQGRLRISSLQEAERRLVELAPSKGWGTSEHRRYLAIVKALLNSEPRPRANCR